MQKVKFLTGLPASGKTTWSKAYCEKNKDWIRVNRDDLRNMRGQYWLPKQEDLITTMERACICSALVHGFNVIVDATNLNKKYLEQMKHEIKYNRNGIDVEFETMLFSVPLEECIKRDLKRANSVGEKVIRNMYDKYFKKDISIKQDKSLPKAIIVDLDGTLAYKENFVPDPRGYYDYSRVYEDLVNVPINKILDAFYFKWNAGGEKTQIIFMSGREDYCMEDTKRWLKDKAGIPRDTYEIYMRKTKDFRKDCIVKKELFDQHVKDKYYVEFILDDRNSVVQMWRDLGLTCLQVAPGDF
jgi:predicted kinase